MSKMGQLVMSMDRFDEVFAQDDRGQDWAAWMDQMEQDYINEELRRLNEESEYTIG